MCLAGYFVYTIKICFVLINASNSPHACNHKFWAHISIIASCKYCVFPKRHTAVNRECYVMCYGNTQMGK